MAAAEGAGLGQQFRAMLVLQVKGDFRRSKEKCVCPPFSFDIISFPNPLMPKDDWIF